MFIRILSLLFLFSFLAVVSMASEAPRTVNLTAADGTRLAATYFDAGKPGPGVLLLHQCDRDRKAWDSLAKQLAGMGVSVLTFDLRGFGESGGTPAAKATPQEAQAAEAKWPGDIDLAMKYLEEQPNVKRDVVGLGGGSCGVNNAVQAAQRHPEVKSLVLLAGNSDLAGRNFLRQDKSIPVLFAYADDDRVKPAITAIQWLYALTANPSKELLHYPNGGHAADIFGVHPELQDRIVEWFKTSLMATPGRAPVPKQKQAVPANIEALNMLDMPGGALKAKQKLAEDRKRDANANLFDETTVNFVGYEHMAAGDLSNAIEIFKLNTTAFPNSPNVYDSLSDAYVAAGEKQLALESAKKALALLESDTADDQPRKDAIRASAEQKLKQLGGNAQ